MKKLVVTIVKAVGKLIFLPFYLMAAVIRAVMA